MFRKHVVNAVRKLTSLIDCSPDNCVSGCDAKPDCDPGGYGAEYVKHETCPLNVCCSKWG